MAFFILISLLLVIAYLMLFEYYTRGWNEIKEIYHSSNGQAFLNIMIGIEKGDKIEGPVKISLIIPFRNEEANVERLFTCIESQLYPRENLEVILVNDHSEDNTWKLINDYAMPGLTIHKIELPDHVSGKKKAIETGIAKATGNLVVTTDADCTFSEDWLQLLAVFYSATGAKFIAAPVKMVGKKNFLGIFQSLDFLTMQGITAVSVHKNLHAMCNGANLAYERQVFFDVNGFEGIDEIPSGDDMLLMQKIRKKYPEKIRYLKSRSAIVETPAETSWKNFFHQRIRWSSKAVHYDDKKLYFILWVVYLVNLTLVILAVATIINVYWLSFLVSFFILKVLVEFPFVNKVSRFFGQQRLMWYFLLMQPVHIIYMVVAGFLGRFGSYEWKSRTIINKGKGDVAKR